MKYLCKDTKVCIEQPCPGSDSGFINLKRSKKKIQLTILISTKIIQIASASMFWHFES